MDTREEIEKRVAITNLGTVVDDSDFHGLYAAGDIPGARAAFIKAMNSEVDRFPVEIKFGARMFIESHYIARGVVPSKGAELLKAVLENIKCHSTSSR